MRAAAETPEGQAHVKRVVSEMGGKNCVIVDSDADLDEVVPAVVHSAFGYAGQKCSAAARVLAHEAVADTLLERLAGAVEVLRVGQAEQFDTDVPPVIERGGAGAGASATSRWPPSRAGSPRARDESRGEGWFCAPAVAAGLPADSEVLNEEIFGPLLAVERRAERGGGLRHRRRAAVRAHRRPVLAQPRDRRVRRAAHARWATSTSTATSPARWWAASRSAATAARARARRPAGPDYLLQFAEPRVVTENTMRHGLVVE